MSSSENSLNPQCKEWAEMHHRAEINSGLRINDFLKQFEPAICQGENRQARVRTAKIHRSDRADLSDQRVNRIVYRQALPVLTREIPDFTICKKK
jgi:hypothetical protein